MIAALKLVPVWAWCVFALISALAVGLGYQTLTLAHVSAEYAEYRADIDKKAVEASEKARETEKQRQRDIDQVRNDAADQKQKDDALAAQQRADVDSLRGQTNKLLADRGALSTRLAQRGKTIADLADLLAQLRSEADGYAGELAAALTASRRAGLACERSYDSMIKQ
jgi:septal ring factor EnvC (AmiA/AmiB activator)